MRKKTNITKQKDLYIMELNEKQKIFIDLCYKEYGEITEITRKQLVEVEKKHKVVFPQWLVSNKDLKISKGVYKMPTSGGVQEIETEKTESQAAYVVLSLIHI